MQTFVNILNDLIIVIGNLTIFSTMLNFKNLKRAKQWTIASVCVLLTVVFILCVYVAHMPYIHASIVCFTFPSLILFWCFSEVRDSRFFLSFCIVDTVSLIIGFITKYFAMFYENVAPYITLTGNLVLYLLIIVGGHSVLQKYAKLMTFQKAGWRSMMIASFVIYFALYFFAAYPTPIKNRLEYAPSYFVFSLVILCCYAVFWDSIVKTKKLHDQNEQLEREKKYHKIAYEDSLTGLSNHAYFVEKINEVERNRSGYRTICTIVMDLNNFKGINDRYGHLVGDQVLQDTAAHITRLFEGLSAFLFRMGGDEFFVLLLDAKEEDVKARLTRINTEIAHNEHLPDRSLSIAYGYSFIPRTETEENLTIEEHFTLADKKMYEHKNEYKRTHSDAAVAP